MTKNELIELLKETGYPVSYFLFDEPPSLPCIVVSFDASDDLHADDRVYKKKRFFDVEIYDEKENEEAKEKIERLLDERGVPWSFAGEISIESERLIAATFSVALYF
ncbi:MAG: hypothetical protein RR547_13310 [Raoultibacter sp.]